LGAANKYLESKPEDVIAGEKRPAFVRRIVDRFKPTRAELARSRKKLLALQPARKRNVGDVEALANKDVLEDADRAVRRATLLVDWLNTVHTEAEAVLGPSQDGWWQRVIDRCAAEAGKDPAGPEAYARAAFRGWGLNQRQADSAVKSALSKERSKG
jgi:hypothetical protein